MVNPVSLQTLVVGGGCFWCTEAVFVRVQGVLDVESGYANGDAERFPQPSYDMVCGGQTGYNEVVKLVYDPSVVGTRQLLEVFMATHDPTSLNRQGNDVGTQYRSGIYFTTPDQEETARLVVAEWNTSSVGTGTGRRAVTEILPLQHYHPAEAYHQDYFENHPHQGYCAFVVGPKVEKFMRTFRSLLKK